MSTMKGLRYGNKVGKNVRLSAPAYFHREKVRVALYSNPVFTPKDRHSFMRAYDKTYNIGHGKKLGKFTKLHFVDFSRWKHKR